MCSPENHICGYMFGGLHAKAYVVWAAYVLEIFEMIHRLDFLKAVRFGRYVLNGLVRCASYEGLYSLGHIFIFR